MKKFLTIVALSFLLVACGGGGDSSGGSADAQASAVESIDITAQAATASRSCPAGRAPTGHKNHMLDADTLELTFYCDDGSVVVFTRELDLTGQLVQTPDDDMSYLNGRVVR